MALLEDLLAGNLRYRETVFTKALAGKPSKPRRELAVVACMDARAIPERILALEPGDANVIRSAGAVVDDGVLRSLVAAVHLLGVNTIIHMTHTDCGLRKLAQDPQILAAPLREHLGATLGENELQEVVQWIEPIDEGDAHGQESIRRITSHRLIPDDIEVHGLLYDVTTGAVTAVPAEP